MTITYMPGNYVAVDVKSNGLADLAIRTFTQSSFCHAFLITKEDGTIVESVPSKGVRESHISNYAGAPMVESTTILTDEQRKGIVKSAYNRVGKDSYGFLDIGYIALYIQGVRWTWLQNQVVDETNKTICSQLVAMCGRENQVPQWMCGKTIPQLVFPSDLANLALS